MLTRGLTGGTRQATRNRGIWRARQGGGRIFSIVEFEQASRLHTPFVLKLRQKVGKQKATPWLGPNLSRGVRVRTQSQLLGVC